VIKACEPASRHLIGSLTWVSEVDHAQPAVTASPDPVPGSAGHATATELLVEVRDVHVTYHVFEDRKLGLRQRISTGQLRRRSREVHAVRGVSFQLHRGDSLGIVGHNGSGKSTLLAALTGLLPVSDGSILVRSRPTLLGVGAALRRQLSGRRNITLGCLAAGMTPTEVDQQMGDIIAFSGLKEFIDMPMNAYSSGMRARLAFSIATARTPEILLVDEALAVGDQQFKERCAARIEAIRQNAGAVVQVSHNMAEIKSSCNRVIWMDHGQIMAEGPTEEILAAYGKSQSDT
jgi:teichoic acid transport system ATP-binding protein